MKHSPWQLLLILAIGLVIGISLNTRVVVNHPADATPTPTPLLEPTPTQEEINERVTKALHLNPPL